MQWPPNLGRIRKYRFMAKFRFGKLGKQPGVCRFLSAQMILIYGKLLAHFSASASKAHGGQGRIRCEGRINWTFYREGPSRLGWKQMATVSISCINSEIHPASCQTWPPFGALNSLSKSEKGAF